MRQQTPKEFGLVKWRGGAGKPGEKGGWGYSCAFCIQGDILKSFPRRSVADYELGVHVLEKHRARAEKALPAKSGKSS